MALTANDLAIMEGYSNHPVILSLTSEVNWDAIRDWYIEVPSITLPEAIGTLSILDRGKFFAHVDFQKWYSDFCLKLHAGGGIPILGYSLEQIKEVSKLLLITLLDFRMTRHSMQELVTEMFSRKTNDALFYLLLCLGCDEIIEQQTLSILWIELVDAPRWQAIGLSAEPTSTDCLNVYSV
jgi:hypothetical protein